ncbi:MAG: hypothetical protein NZ841_01750 [Dictyoglomus sp.]|nr:hypothetical protein [Dictyoglomus sp.]MCX7942124.1 hypothetical protein [Dictyoglomaceae bacterium]MDW8188011.1 hypothetical protein [Dictyoglomus sp.]
MKRLFIIIFLFLFSFYSTAQEILDITLIKVIKLGNESVNFFKILGDILFFSQKDFLVLYSIKEGREINRIRVRSSAVKEGENILVTNFQPLDTGKVIAVNNEPYLTIFDYIKRIETPLSYNKVNTLRENTKVLTTQIEKIEDLIISPLGNFIIEKVNFKTFLLGGFIQLDEWYEYNILTFPKREKLYSLSSKRNYFEFDLIFSNKEKYLLILNPILRDSKKNYALIVKDLKTGKDLEFFYEGDRTAGWSLSQDDRYLAITLGEEEKIKVIDLFLLREILTLPYIGNPFLSPTGDFLAIEGNKTITVFSLRDNKPLFTVFGSHPVFSYDNRFLAYSLGEHYLAPTKEIVIYSWRKEVRKKIDLDGEYFLEKMEFTLDSKYLILLLMGGDGYRILVFQVKGG